MKRKNGFTFIEMILYVSIVTIVLSAMVPFAWSIMLGSTKSNTEQEVFSQSRFISEKIKQEIRNSTGINSVTTISISLANSDATKNPTVIDLSAGNLRVKQGVGATVNLNSPDTKVTDLLFVNNTSGDGKTENITFEFVISSNYTNKGQAYTESSKVRTSAEIRTN